MINKCNVIRDILPVYTEDMISRDTAEFVEEHLSSCENCKKAYEEMKTDIVTVKNNSEPLRKIEKKLKNRKIMIILITVFFVLISSVSVFSFLTAPNYLPYKYGRCEVTENSDGIVYLAFDGEVSRYDCYGTYDPDLGQKVYYIETWTTPIDGLFYKNRGQTAVIYPSDDIYAVYYVQNNGEDNIFLYGSEPDSEKYGSAVPLPRLSLVYYFSAACFLFVLSAILLPIKKNRPILSKICLYSVFLSASYIAGHIFIKGLSFKTYSLPRDFSLICIVTFLIFGLLSLLFKLIFSKAEEKKYIL